MKLSISKEIINYLNDPLVNQLVDRIKDRIKAFSGTWDNQMHKIEGKIWERVESLFQEKLASIEGYKDFFDETFENFDIQKVTGLVLEPSSCLTYSHIFTRTTEALNESLRFPKSYNLKEETDLETYVEVLTLKYFYSCFTMGETSNASLVAEAKLIQAEAELLSSFVAWDDFDYSILEDPYFRDFTQDEDYGTWNYQLKPGEHFCVDVMNGLFDRWNFLTSSGREI